MLVVAQKDNMETSSCLISPPHVNFLVNGRGVERRTTAYVDVGPQFPTDITNMLKYGTNLLQAVGFFGGNYVVAVAFVSKMVSSGIPLLQDYVQPVAATVAQADGSWKIVEDHGAADKPHEMLTGGGDDIIDCEPNGPSNSLSGVVDLTMEEDIPTDVGLNLREIEALNSLLNQSGTSNACVSHGQVRDELWSRISLATTTSVVLGNVSQPNIQIVGAGLHAQNPSLYPVITDAVSPALNREDADNFLLPTSPMQSSMQAQQFLDNWQLQQTHLGNSIRPQTATHSLTSVPSVSVQASPSVLLQSAFQSFAEQGPRMNPTMPDHTTTALTTFLAALRCGGRWEWAGGNRVWSEMAVGRGK
ncbi:hypothetical protein Taro_028663 [Colocasia esculenta]|uniref:Uncharacterized protein n=1 Tax=Colocasia esculenta TaxID=4460 RepID=A0A843VJ72_COLES|nr:hypothetical protein [Colocasia esculenta]